MPAYAGMTIAVAYISVNAAATNAGGHPVNEGGSRSGPHEPDGMLVEAVDRRFARLTGQQAGDHYGLSTWLFLRGLGAIYLIAFASLWVQVEGLIGPSGILPAEDLLDAARTRFGLERYRYFPTLFWLGAGSSAIHLGCGVGVVAAILVMIGVATLPCLVLLWALYLSLAVVSQDFLSFQWDTLLLETGLLATLVARGAIRGGRRAVEPNALALALLWWLVFRLTFESGVVKLTSGDLTWRNLTALDYHLFTQPLPTWTAWYAQQSPDWIKRLAVVGVFALELVSPLLIWLGRTGRRVAFAGVLALQVGIGATGNYGVFNLLTIVAALPLLDDRLASLILPKAIVARVRPEPNRPRLGGRVRSAAGLLLLVARGFTVVETVAPGWAPIPLTRWIAPFRSVNGYGLFRVMTTTRPEIIVEGSRDGIQWQAYEFRHKPGDPTRRPEFIEPHQPRLDWQMWFAALGQFESEAWFRAFLGRLLEGSPPVTALLARNPFPGDPPRYVRARQYGYRFTTPAERRRESAWWARSPIGDYSPVLSLRP